MELQSISYNTNQTIKLSSTLPQVILEIHWQEYQVPEHEVFHVRAGNLVGQHQYDSETARAIPEAYETDVGVIAGLTEEMVHQTYGKGVKLFDIDMVSLRYKKISSNKTQKCQSMLPI